MKTKEFIKLIEGADFKVQDSGGYLYVSKVNHSGYTSGLCGRVSKKHEYCFDTNYILFAQLCTDIRGLITSALYAYSQTPIEEREPIEPIENTLDPIEVEPLVVPKEIGEFLDTLNLGLNSKYFNSIDLLRDYWNCFDLSDELWQFIFNNNKHLIDVVIGNRRYEVME